VDFPVVGKRVFEELIRADFGEMYLPIVLRYCRGDTADDNTLAALVLKTCATLVRSAVLSRFR
jgi:hypothetical protein